MHFQVSAHLITMHIIQLLSLNSFKMYRVYKLDKQMLPPPSPTTMPLPPVPVYSWGMMKKDILSSNKVEAKRLPWYPVLLSSLDYKHLEDRDPHHSVLPREDITLLDDSDQQTHWRAKQEPAGCCAHEPWLLQVFPTIQGATSVPTQLLWFLTTGLGVRTGGLCYFPHYVIWKCFQLC